MDKIPLRGGAIDSAPLRCRAAAEGETVSGEDNPFPQSRIGFLTANEKVR